MSLNYDNLRNLVFFFLALAVISSAAGAISGYYEVAALASGILALVALTSCWLADKVVREKYHWYEGILDAVPLPLSVTDLDMRWTFVNKVVEDLLQKKRHEIAGMACNNWGANICNTEDCGVACLRRGQEETLSINGPATSRSRPTISRTSAKSPRVMSRWLSTLRRKRRSTR